MTARGRLLKLLEDLGWHDHRDLERVAGNRYAARLLELKRLGYRIEDRSGTKDGKAYRLLSREPSEPQGKRVKVFLDEADADALSHGRITAAAVDAVGLALASFRANRGKL